MNLGALLVMGPVAKPSAVSTVATFAVTPPRVVTAPAPAPPVATSTARVNASPATQNGGCGPEPPHNYNAPGLRKPYVDPAAGTAWLACMDRVSARRAEPVPVAPPPPSPPPPPPPPAPLRAGEPGPVPQAPSPLPNVSGGGGGSSSPDPGPGPGPSAPGPQQQQQPAPASAGPSTGLLIGGAVAVVGVALGLYFAFR